MTPTYHRDLDPETGKPAEEGGWLGRAVREALQRRRITGAPSAADAAHPAAPTATAQNGPESAPVSPPAPDPALQGSAPPAGESWADQIRRAAGLS